MKRYEVTVPVTVVVETEPGRLPQVTGWRFGEWGGFFSDAEEAEGVWDADEGEWGADRQRAIAGTARSFVQSQVKGPEMQGGKRDNAQ